MEFPTWLAEILKQFPVVALCGVVLWRAAKYFDAKHTEESQALQSQHDSRNREIADLTSRYLEDLKTQHAGQVESMQREVDRLVASQTETTKDRDRLLRRLIPDEKKD